MKHFDIIGDIHGQVGKLERLFRVLGYEKIGGVYGSADRKAVFVGDLIDRGPAIGETLEIVKLWSTQAAGSARWVTTSLTRWPFTPLTAMDPTFARTLRKIFASMLKRWSFSRRVLVLSNIT
jgi:Calcineurin-like phosphoesterase